MVFNAPYLENEHGDPPFLAFWQKLMFTLLHGRFLKKSDHGNSLGAHVF